MLMVEDNVQCATLVRRVPRALLVLRHGDLSQSRKFMYPLTKHEDE